MAEDPVPGPQAPPDNPPRFARRAGELPSLPAHAGGSSLPALDAPRPHVDESRVREPSVDLVRSPGRLYVTVELPGASRETIDIEATDRRLAIRANGRDGLIYSKEIELPEPVEPDSVRASYRNGVLDVTIPLRRASERESESGEDHA